MAEAEAVVEVIRIFVVVDYYEYRMNTSILIHLVTCRSIQRNCPLNES